MSPTKTATMRMNRTIQQALSLFGLVAASANSPGPRLTSPGRRLEDVSTFEYNDLSQYSVRFEKCQFVKSYDDEFAGDEDNDSPLATKHFVVYRLCPTNSCESCNDKYGT